MKGEISNNIDFYSKYVDLCDCVYCKYYIENVGLRYPNYYKKLLDMGVDINKPFEVDLPYLNQEGFLIYPLVQYIVLGKISDFTENIDGLDIRIASFYPNTNLDENHFVIEIGPLIFGNGADFDFIEY